MHLIGRDGMLLVHGWAEVKVKQVAGEGVHARNDGGLRRLNRHLERGRHPCSAALSSWQRLALVGATSLDERAGRLVVDRCQTRDVTDELVKQGGLNEISFF